MRDGGDGDGDDADGASTGTGGGDGGGGDGGGVECGEFRCSEFATCKKRDDEATCICDDGYQDVAGDGTDCDDIDECASSDLNSCARRARCDNTPGGYTCECPSPQYTGDGKHCDCAKGYVHPEDDDSLCLGENGSACEGGLDCLSDECVSGTCCAHACDEPGICETSDGAMCSDGSTCAYPQAAEGATCYDDDQCTKDVCDADGVCRSSPYDVEVDCDPENPCQVAGCDPEIGCTVTPVPQGVACDDDNPCTTSSECNGEGLCVGTGVPSECDDDNPCTADGCEPDGDEIACVHEPQEGSCDAPDSCATGGTCEAGECASTGNACGGGAVSCTPGDPPECECDEPDYRLSGGVCVPNTDECETDNPCVDGASCKDTSAAPDDAVCTCPEGAGGDGRRDGSGCTPCRDTDLTKEVGGRCVCDLEGTFALRIETVADWPQDGAVEGAKGLSTYSYSLRTQTYDDDGTLVVTERACGGTVPDTCVNLGVLGGREAYHGEIPASVWDSGNIKAVSRPPVGIPDARPGRAFYMPPTATILGLSIPDPMGSWPSRRSSGSITWLDSDRDGPLGVTTEFWGSSAGNSKECPRSGSGTYGYDYPRLPSGARASKVYGGTRIISALRGTIVDCDTMRGSVEGRTEGSTFEADARVYGCVVAASGADCSADDVDTLDQLENKQVVKRAEFVLMRTPSSTTCAQARRLDFEGAPN